MPTQKDIKDPKTIQEYFDAYYKEVKSSPRIIYDFVGKDGTEVKKRLERPLTIEGFFTFCRKNYKVSLEHYWYNTDGAYDEYCSIISHVKAEIRQDQIEGGMVGQYNSNLTARLNGLTDKQEHTTITNPPIFPDID